MPNLLSLESLENDRKFVERQREKAPKDRWGTTKMMWDQRLSEINERIEQIKASPAKHASVALIFDGLPVIGQGEIRLDFSTEALAAYQRIVSAAMASQNDEAVAAKGKVKGEQKSKLYIRDIVRGSMGFILEESTAPQTDMFNTPLKNAVEQATQLISNLSGSSNEEFVAALEATSPRLVGALQKFTKVLHDAGATTKIVGDENRVALGLEDISRLSSRFSDVEVTEEDSFVEGVLLGILPDSHEFELQLPENGGTIKGAVADGLTSKYVNDQQFKEQLLLKPVKALIRYTRTFRNDRLIKQQLSLENLEPRVESPTLGVL
ncbi:MULTISPECIES: hypothetical protein [unclassified Rhizobium]|uniref:hypothetical protein n=1 Tax=unclassified Rhizobium TaxID=2613769 RepID=UPI0007EBAA6E|nr:MULTISPECIES: hypothetical protein [unclassified Rhizobium]ANK84172.1 hypothetical protein AMK02_CH00527 [Rhizobium sp. N731]ANL14420.1 hypothetical protein AMJ97_CH00527 [Rhizobium sp. N1314]